MSTLVLRSYETTETEKLLPSALDAGNGAPLAYSLQSSFKIGHRVAPSPLVSTSQLQAHLNLLKAFKDLKDRVEQHPQGLPQLAISLDAEKRWVWFLQLAVERCVSIVSAKISSNDLWPGFDAGFKMALVF